MYGNKLITVLGPTATGKTFFAAHLAKQLNAEIISADSRQVYRGMDLGTGKDLEDYLIEGVQIPYHLIDIKAPGYEYNVFEFQHDFLKAYRDIISRNKTALMCGGTGMYLDAVLKAYNMVEVPENAELREELKEADDESLKLRLEKHKEPHNVSDTSDRDRLIRAIEIREFNKHNPGQEKFPKLSSLNFGIYFDRFTIKKRITERLEKRLKHGMIEEVQTLLGKGIKAKDLIFYGLEYKLVTQYVIGELSFDEMFSKLEIAIHQFSKRQMTWFRRMEKQGIKIHWIDGNLGVNEKVEFALTEIKKSGFIN